MIEADPVSAVLRGVYLAAMASLFGALVFSAMVVRTPPDTPASRLLQRRLAVLVRGSLAPALLAGLAWFTARAAGAWLGALTPLLILLATLPEEAAPALRRFFPLGLGAVLVIAATSVVQGLAMVGSVPALVGTGYGRLALA